MFFRRLPLTALLLLSGRRTSVDVFVRAVDLVENVGDEICAVGYVMDHWCINEGVLIDNRQFRALSRPDQHSYHCLLDVTKCTGTDYEILIDSPDPGVEDYCRGFVVDQKGHAELLALGQQNGKKGYCSTCKSNAADAPEMGFRATIKGVVTSLGDAVTPASVEITEVLDGSVGCEAGTEKTPISGRTCRGLAAIDPGTAPTPDPGVTYDFTEQLSDEVLLEYSIDTTAGTISARVTYDGNGWVALAVSENGIMEGSVAVVGQPGNGEPQKYDLLGGGARAVVAENSRQTLTDESVVQANDETILTFTKILEEADEVPIKIDGSSTWILYAHGTSNTLGYHGQRNKGAKELTFGGATTSPTASPAPTAALAAEFESRIRLTDRLTMEYAVENGDDPTAATLSARLVYDGLGWIGIGVSPDGQMVGGEAIVGIPNSGLPPRKYRLGGKNLNAVAPLPQSRQTLTDASIEQANGQTIMTFKKLLDEEGEIEIRAAGDNQLIYAVGSGDELAQHAGGQSRGAQTLDLSTGSSTEVEIPHQTEWKAHGGMAFAGWGVMTPLAIASSWLRDIFPGNGLWFKAHMIFNALTFALTAALFGVAVSTFNKQGLDHFAGGTPASTHTRMGLAMFILVCLQVLGGFLRPHLPSTPDSPPPRDAQREGDDSGKEGEGGGVRDSMPDDFADAKAAAAPEKSKVRIGWEFLHKLSGLALLGCGLWQINRGLELYETIYEETLISKGAFWGWIGGFAGVVVFLTIYDKVLSKKKV